MATLLLDTNIVSYAIKDDTRRLLKEKHVAGHRTCLCFMSIAELYRWAIGKHWGQRRIDSLEIEVKRHIVLPYDDDLAWTWARVRSIKGLPVDPSDAWIAAAALRHNLPLVTHNRRHFEAVPGLQLISEA
jgi:tRNA(fMet)-specific endonuclease VapC